MALIAAHLILNAGIIFGGGSVVIGIYIISLFPHLHTPFLSILPIPNKPYGFCGR